MCFSVYLWFFSDHFSVSGFLGHGLVVLDWPALSVTGSAVITKVSIAVSPTCLLVAGELFFSPFSFQRRPSSLLEAPFRLVGFWCVLSSLVLRLPIFSSFWVATLLCCSFIKVRSLCVLVVYLLLILFWLIQVLLLIGAKLKFDGKLF